MSKTLAVAKWEFVEKVKTKAFIIGLVMMPLIMSLFGILPGLLTKSEEEQAKKIGIIDETHFISPQLQTQFYEKYKLKDGSPIYQVVPIVDSDLGTEQLKVIASAKLTSGEIAGYFIIPFNVVDSGKVEYRSENVGNVRDQERFSRVLEEIILERRASTAGYDPAVIKKLTKDVDIKTIKVSKEGTEKESGFLDTFFTGYIFIIMLMFLVMTTGQMLIRSVLEEKSNRIIEVLVSSCSSRELMMGKILGLALLGMTTVIFWIIILLGVNIASPIPFAGFENIVLPLIYFVLAYLMYVAVFIMAGSTVSTEQEAQQMTQYVSLVLILPIVLAVPVMLNPDSLIVKILSQIPFVAPTMMIMRFSVQMPEWWEIGLSIFTLLITIWLLMWMAAKIFRIGILITGKRPNFKEIISWMRTE